MQFHPKDLSELDELTEEHLGFSALSEGLGFAKQSKKAPQKSLEDFDRPVARESELQRKASSGIGAVAAGPARPAQAPIWSATPPASAPVSTPASRAARADSSALLGGARPAATAQPAPAPRMAPAPQANVLAEPAAPRELRAAAFLIDLLILFVPMAAGWWLSFGNRALAIFNLDRRPPLALFGLIVCVYFLLSESFGGQSLGKMMLGLRVVEDDKYQKPTGLPHAAKRLFLLIAGASLGGLGLLASFWDAKRRPWHDRYSGSIVRRKA